MCGRYVLATPIDELARYFEAREAPGVADSYLPSFNVAPTRDVLGLARDRDGDRLIDTYHWGLIPSWAKDPTVGNRLFNARAETLVTKPAFRHAFQSRRLAVLSDGFFEWRKGPGKLRQPFYLVRADGAPIAFAGLWEVWRDPSVGDKGGWLRSCTIVTTDANPDVSPIHDRMPVLLDPDALAAWLDTDANRPDDLVDLLVPSPLGTLVARPVDRRVGNVRNDDPGLLEPVEPVGE